MVLLAPFWPRLVHSVELSGSRSSHPSTQIRWPVSAHPSHRPYDQHALRRGIENLPTGVAKAAIEAGLPATSVKQFLGALLGSEGDITTVPGVTKQIIGKAVAAIADISAQSFKYVWIANMAIGLATAFGKYLNLLGKSLIGTSILLTNPSMLVPSACRRQDDDAC